MSFTLVPEVASVGAGTLPPELVLLQETVRRFMLREARPEEDKVRHDAYKLAGDALHRLKAKGRVLGLWRTQTPEASGGGAGLSLLAQAVVIKVDASTAKLFATKHDVINVAACFGIFPSVDVVTCWIT